MRPAAPDHDPRLRTDIVQRNGGDGGQPSCLYERAAFLGLVPRQDGTGGKVKLGPISKRGNGYLRRLLVNGAMAVLCSKRVKADPWLAKLLETKKRKVAACALPNKMARIGWAVMIRQKDFRRPRAGSAVPNRRQPGPVLAAPDPGRDAETVR
jgi:hypothetical protein